ncbi:hypothetical protein SBV1_2790002 [Verrucomicrobia bacterium]|nr:hypothetical protein SBV1_2790002 [Verrucomicrobiota bacterium]
MRNELDIIYSVGVKKMRLPVNGMSEEYPRTPIMKRKNYIPFGLTRLTNPLPGLRAASFCALLFSLWPVVSQSARADSIEYAVTTQNHLGTVDLQTGAFTDLGVVVGIAGGETGDLARRPEGLIYGMDSQERLVLVNPTTLTTSLVGYTGNAIFALAFRPDGTLFGLGSGGGLYTIDQTNGNATFIANVTGVSVASYYDLRFDSAGNCYFLNASENLFSLNVTNGQASPIGSIGYVSYNLTYDSGTLYGLTVGGKIISINTTTGAGTVVSTESQGSVYPIVAAAPGGNVVGAPTLSIQSTNANFVTLSWVAPTNGFTLQHNQDLRTTNWTDLTHSVSSTNSFNWVIISPALSQDFFRLISN